jgi:hypothetical protein
MKRWLWPERSIEKIVESFPADQILNRSSYYRLDIEEKQCSSSEFSKSPESILLVASLFGTTNT